MVLAVEVGCWWESEVQRKGLSISNLVISFEAKLKIAGLQIFFQGHTNSEAALCYIVCMSDEFHRTVERTWS
jgi:hypothetical protein